MFRHCLRYLREYQRVPVPSKQAVGTEPLGARSLGDVFQIFLPVDELAQILFNDHSDKSRGVPSVGCGEIVLIFKQFRTLRETLDELSHQLFLLVGCCQPCITGIDFLSAIPGSDVSYKIF